MNRIALFQIWLGPLPWYFEHHHLTCLTQQVDFFFLTDQEVDPKYQAQNFKIIKITKSEVEDRLLKTAGIKYEFKNSYKLCDVKPAIPNLFGEHTSDYEYVGWYDTDTLFGDILSWISPYLDEFDIISFGEDGIYDRVSGPFTIIRNDDRIKRAYLNDYRFIESLKKDEYDEYDERKITQTYRSLNFSIKIIKDASNMDPITNAIRFDAVWYGGKVYVESKERLIHHFLAKDSTVLEKRGNSIISYRKKNYLDDFTYVTYFTENYERLAESSIIRSIKKYSNRRCLVYTVNYESKLIHELSDQFIFRRIDFDFTDDTMDERGRSVSTIFLKPKITLDSVRSFPDKKFVYVDGDSYITASMDGIGSHFSELETYPLANSHIHDVMYFRLKNGQEVDPVNLLINQLSETDSLYPRRKANILLYDKRSEWFFEEELAIYEKYRKTDLNEAMMGQDEDILNAMLAVYNFKKFLPVCDLEEAYSIDINKIRSYSYSATPISESAKLPESDVQIREFHGFKKIEDFNTIDLEYGSSVFSHDDISFTYSMKDSMLIIGKNFIHLGKNIDPMVRISVESDDFSFTCDWNINSSQFFYIWDFILSGGKVYALKLTEIATNRLVYFANFSV